MKCDGPTLRETQAIKLLLFDYFFPMLSTVAQTLSTDAREISGKVAGTPEKATLIST